MKSFTAIAPPLLTMKLDAFMFFLLTVFYMTLTVASNEHIIAVLPRVSQLNPQIVKFLLTGGAKVNAINSNLEEALIAAASNGHLEAVKVLIHIGARVNVVDLEGRTALMHAAFHSRFDVVQYLIESRSDINATDNRGKTALMYAASVGCLDTVKYLIVKGADIDTVDLYGRTALIRACRYFEIVKALFANGADVNTVDRDQKTALIHAGRSDSWIVAKYLIEYGASVKHLFLMNEYHLIASLREYFEWNLTDLEFPYALVLSEINSEKKEKLLHIFWTKVESWVLLGANVSDVIHKLSEKTVSKEFTRIVCTDGLFESFLFDYFEYFQSKNEFKNSAFDFSNEDEFVHLSVEDVKSIFRIQFGRMRFDQISINEFLALNQNVIRFADFIQAEELSNKIADLIFTFNIFDIEKFDSFWIDFKLVFGYYYEQTVVVVDPQFRNLCTKLIHAAIRKKKLVLLWNIVRKLERDNLGYVIDAFLNDNDLSDDIRRHILAWIQ